MGAVKEVMVVVESVSAVRWKTSVEALLVPVGTEEDAKKATGSSFTAWKVVVAAVVVEKVGGMDTVMVERVTVEVAVVLAVVAWVAVEEAWPVQESVMKVELELVVVAVPFEEETR
jgi:hypothetical protein